MSVHSSVVLTFSEAIKASNVTDAAVRLISGTGTPIASTKGLSTDGRTLTLKPVTVPVAPISVSLEVTNALTDLAGNGSTQIRSTFKMPAMIALGAPISAEPGLTPAEHPTIKIMADGTPVVAFSEMSAGSKNVYVFKWADRWTQIGGPFSGMTGAATDTGPPSLSVAGSRIAIAWAESVWGYNSDVFAKELNNGVWSSMPTLPDQAASSMFPIVLQDNNSVRVSWFVNESQTSRTARWDRASPGWTDIADLTGIFPWARAMEGTASGPIYAAASLRYYLPTDVASREFSLQVLNGSTWTPVGTSIRPPDGYHVGKSSLSLTTQGIPIAAFTTADTTRAYVSMYKNVSGGWQRIGLDIPETVGREDDFSFLLINDLPALATTSLTTNDELISILKWDGAAIIPYETLNGNPLPNTPASNPSLAADVTGCLFATWAESSVVARDIFVYKCNR